MKVLVLLVVLSVASAASAAQGQEVYCGRRLAIALALLCEGPEEDKRAAWSGWSSLPVEETAPHRGWPAWPARPQPWLHASRAHSLTRPKRQVVMECCMKPCSEDELMTYC